MQSRVGPQITSRLAGRAAAITTTGLLLLGLAAWCLVMSSASLSTETRAQFADVARNFSSALFLTGGVLCMVSWRVTRNAVTARSAIALLVIGTALPATAVLGLVAHDGPTVELEAPQSRALIVVPLIVIALFAARHSRQLMRLTIALLTVTVLAVPCAVLAVASGAPTGQHHTNAWLALESLAAAAWITLAAQSWRRRRIAGRRTPGWLAAASILLAVGEILKAYSLTAAHAPHGAAGGFQLAAAVIVVAVAAGTLGTLTRSGTAQSGELTRALVDTQQRLTDVEGRERQRLHDARSAVLGVIGASKLLSGQVTTTSSDPDLLRALVTEELLRLQGLLDTDECEAITEFTLADALGTVVFARRMDGLVIDADWHGLSALGRPRTTATALDNLLRNAQRHAPGAQVGVSARLVDGQIEIVVRDDGPGIPRCERGLVLVAGWRGSTARGAGSGLGLSNAAAAMADQDGSLRIETPAGGGTQVVLRLPAVSTAHPAMAS